MVATGADVRRLRKRLEAAGLPASEIAAEVRELLAAADLERVAAHAEATVAANERHDRAPGLRSGA